MAQLFGLQDVAVFEIGEDRHADIDLAADQQMLMSGRFCEGPARPEQHLEAHSQVGQGHFRTRLEAL